MTRTATSILAAAVVGISLFTIELAGRVSVPAEAPPDVERHVARRVRGLQNHLGLNPMQVQQIGTSLRTEWTRLWGLSASFHDLRADTLAGVASLLSNAQLDRLHEIAEDGPTRPENSRIGSLLHSVFLREMTDSPASQEILIGRRLKIAQEILRLHDDQMTEFKKLCIQNMREIWSLYEDLESLNARLAQCYEAVLTDDQMRKLRPGTQTIRIADVEGLREYFARIGKLSETGSVS